MSHLILVRHGQSEWNLQKKFTGWVDVDLTPEGKLEACKAGEAIKNLNINIDNFYSSFQIRSINTLKLIQNTLRVKTTPERAWQLNERHYGALTGLNKDEMKKKLGEKKIHEFRRSWDLRPDPLNRNSPYHPINMAIYKSLKKEDIPDDIKSAIRDGIKDMKCVVSPRDQSLEYNRLKSQLKCVVSPRDQSLEYNGLKSQFKKNWCLPKISKAISFENRTL